MRTTCSTPYLGFAAGPDGKLWFLETHGPVAIGRLDPRRLVDTGQLPEP